MSIFNKELDQRSPVHTLNYNRTVKYDEDQNEIVIWEERDMKKFQKSLGSVNDWSLQNLVKAGIDPNFGIHTGYNTRLEGFNDLGIFNNLADSIIEEKGDETPKNE